MQEKNTLETLRVEISNVPKRTNAPLLNYCRDLIAKGTDPNTRVEFLRNGRADVIIPNLGEGAKLTVKEDKDTSPKFIKYVPFPEDLKARGKVAGSLKDALK